MASVTTASSSSGWGVRKAMLNVPAPRRRRDKGGRIWSGFRSDDRSPRAPTAARGPSAVHQKIGKTPMRRHSWLKFAFLLTPVLGGCNGAGAAPPEEGVEPSPVVASTAARTEAAPVLPGLEVILRDSVHLLEGRRVGFITNQTAVTADGRSGIDLLHEAPGVHLAALYGPEHGLRGGVEGGVRIESGVDEATCVPIHSLYGSTQRPTLEMLEGIDILLFDMQDIGARPYTFVWTMAMAMEAASAQGIPFVVLDRPNPITGTTEGPLMDPEMRNVGQPITGYYPVPLRHGMTVGEIARYVNV